MDRTQTKKRGGPPPTQTTNRFAPLHAAFPPAAAFAGKAPPRHGGDKKGPSKSCKNPRAIQPTPEELALRLYVEQNPHCGQVRTELVRPFFGAKDFEPAPLEGLPELLTEASPRMPFVDRPDKDRSTLHYGQVKLFLSELWFLTARTAACKGADMTVVYAGAAPGHHIPFLAELFPACRFILYDPAPYCCALEGAARPANIDLYQDFFGEEVAAELGAKLANGPHAFICDIRTGREEEYVECDMARQKIWTELLKPDAALLKFRLPWAAGTTRYLGGQIRLQAFAPLTSTEHRLVTTPECADRDYDNLEYEQACAYHNTVGRVRSYAHDVEAPGLDHCHDCATLVATCGGYLRQSGADASAEAIGGFIGRMFDAFGTGRNLASSYARSSNRAAKKYPPRSYKNNEFRQGALAVVAPPKADAVPAGQLAATNRASSQALERKNSLNTFSAPRTVVTQNAGNASKATECADMMRHVHPTYMGFICVAQSDNTGENVGMRKQLALTASVCTAGEALPP